MNISSFYKKSSIAQKEIFALYILSFLIATSTHIKDIISEGFFPYTNFPFWVNAYWTLLTFFDPLAIIIICLSLRFGKRFYAVIIFSDVAINLYFTISTSGFKGIFNIYMLGQLSFLCFLVATWNIMNQDKIIKK